MRFGFALPQIGSVAGPDALAAVAERAEAVGYDSLWILDRILWPVNPRAPYPVGDGSLPEQYKNVLDPMETLTFAAARTSRIALATGVLNLPWYNPVLLARQLTTLDVLSRGRLRIGFGIGWSPDEYEAAGVAWQERGKRADEALKALKKIWTTDPVEFEGKYYRIPKSFIGPKPVQKPHPPIYMAAFVPSAMRRVAIEADGWLPVGIPLGEVGAIFDGIKKTAKEAGRDPSALELIINAAVQIHPRPVEKDRADFTGTLEQIAEDFSRAQKLGAAEVVIYAQFLREGESAGDLIARMEDLRRAAKQA
ncbi:MAG TPA: LLM class F420-dependent oxidoreductase [Candidatus Acidoferrales bacterium]|nr:LLM class F420-dependent oxidoreductase [Candidatus Acidoferrales bacterium]